MVSFRFEDQRHHIMERAVSGLGRQAKFGAAEDEIKRILAHKTNYYIVLKVSHDAPESEMKFNYLRLSRLVHPDKCSLEGAAEASSTLNLAKDTLMNPLKKKLYDAYLDDIAKGKGANKDEYTYAEWEAKMAQMPVQLPKWLMTLLSIPGVNLLVALLILCILLPLILVVFLLGFVMWLLCLPINILFKCCCPDRWEAELKKRMAESSQGDDPSDAPQQQEV